MPVHVENHRAMLRVPGPPNPFRVRCAAKPWSTSPRIIDPAQPIARFTLGPQAFILREGEWSDWIETDFPLLWPFSARGMFRVYAKRLAGGFGVYVSPVNIDPAKPEAKISAPTSYSALLARAAGLYYTQGIPQDTARVATTRVRSRRISGAEPHGVARATDALDARAGRLPRRPALLSFLRRGSGFAHAVAQIRRGVARYVSHGGFGNRRSGAAHAGGNC